MNTIAAVGNSGKRRETLRILHACHTALVSAGHTSDGRCIICYTAVGVSVIEGFTAVGCRDYVLVAARKVEFNRHLCLDGNYECVSIPSGLELVYVPDSVMVLVEVTSLYSVTVGEDVSVTVVVTSSGYSVSVTVSAVLIIFVFVCLIVFLGPWIVVVVYLVEVTGTFLVQRMR